MQAVGQVGEAHDLAPKMGSQLFAALQGSVGDHDRFGLARRKMGRTQLDHLAGPDKQDPDLREVFEQLARKPHGRGCHADRMGADFGGRAHLLGHGKRTLEHLAQGGAQGARLFGRTHGVLQLAEDLRLAQHHGIEAAGHTEGVARRHAVFEGVGMGAQHCGRNATRLGQPVQRRLQFGVFTGTIDFRPVAGGDNCRFRLTGQGLAQSVQRGLDLFGGEREPAAQIERRGGVVDAEGPDCHSVWFARIIKFQPPWA